MQYAGSAVDTLDLDHIGFIVPELAAARVLFEGLGFTLTARADHTRRDAEGRVVPAGSAQHSVMFDTGYIELMQITDPLAGHQLTPAMRERYGLHVLALGTGDAEACHAARRQAGLPVGAVMDWSRPVSTPERSGLARFLYFDTRWSPGDPSYVCWVQHATPELVRSPSLLRHANGATAMRGLRYAGPSAALQAWAARLRQAGAQAAGFDGAGRLSLGESWIELVPDETMPRVLPVALTIAFPSLAPLQAAAQRLGLAAAVQGPDALGIDLGPGFGLTLHAVQEAPAR
jgi:catechol 2,3-dioxygenase-like lactoylglutathione lyase family enzyme